MKMWVVRQVRQVGSDLDDLQDKLRLIGDNARDVGAIDSEEDAALGRAWRHMDAAWSELDEILIQAMEAEENV